MAENKLDIFDLLRFVDKNDGNWFSKQPPEAQKQFAAPVVLRWASSIEEKVEGAYMLMMVNETVNVHMYDLYKHPELIYRLLASCGIGKVARHQWIAGNKRKSGNNKAYDLFLRIYSTANSKELDMLISKYTKETFSELVAQSGFSSSEEVAIIKDFEALTC